MYSEKSGRNATDCDFDSDLFGPPAFLSNETRMITSLVVTTTADARAISHVQRAIGERSEFEVGDAIENRLPVVLEASDPGAAETATRWLLSLPHVSHVDVVFVAYDEATATDATPNDTATEAVIRRDDAKTDHLTIKQPEREPHES